ncbi:MAG: ribosomal RNA small subunit methyltransferase A [Syntrophomonadaceae bacterium]|nr:ribosomal RNA small subunit methyltransferase A [Syntrophomonadaceae bacterium]
MFKTDSLSEVKRLVRDYQIYPRKKWGQNFLFDRNILDKIVNCCELDLNDFIIEIGAGLGGLTRLLALRSGGVLAFEVDTRFKAVLNEVLAGLDNVRLIFADVLQVDIEEELKKSFSLDKIPFYKVCANIPYSITTPIIFHLLEKCVHMQSAVLMVQKEVADRILASPGDKDYGLLTLMVAYYSDVKFLMKVSSSCFYPSPEIESSVIQIKPLKEKRVAVENEKIFKQFLRTAFQRRRKTILNTASLFFNLKKDEAQKKMEQIGILPANRPEDLSIEDFALLTNAFSS